MKKTLILFGLFAGAAWGQCGANGQPYIDPFTGKLACTGKVGGAGYSTTFSGVTGLTVTAATHAQGTKPVGVCYDNATPANLITQTANFPTVAANGDMVFAWSGSKTGYCLISAWGNQVGPTGQTGAAGSTGPAPSGTGVVVVNSGTASSKVVSGDATFNASTGALTVATVGGVTPANASLNNLSGVSINTSLLAQTGVDAGSTAAPFRNLYLFGAGTYGTTSFQITGTPTAARVWTLPDATDTFVGTAATQTLTNKTVDGVSPATFGFLDPTSSVQTQLNNRALLSGAVFTGTVKVPNSFSTTQCMHQLADGTLAPTGNGDCGTGGGGGANTALSNLASVSLNTSLLAQAGVDAGSQAAPFRNINLYGSGTFGTTSITLTGAPTSNRQWTFPDVSDTVVGLTSTQTVTNKTIDGVSPTTMGFVDPTSSIQTQLNSKAPTANPTFTGKVDASGASHALLPTFASTGVLPASGCTAGELAVVTGATAGQMIYQNSTNGTCTWTQQLNSGGAGNANVAYCVTTGTGSAYVCAPNPAATSYTVPQNMILNIVPNVACTAGAVTINVSGLGTKSVKLADGTTDPLGSSCPANLGLSLFYDGTVFRIFNGYDPTKSGAALFSGLTSGAVALAADDVAGTAITYLLPSTNGSAGQVLSDNGAVTCSSNATLPTGFPTVCHQLTWISAAGSGTVTTTGSPAIHQIAIFSGASAIKGLTVGTNGQLLAGATGADAAFVTLSGDCTMTSAGVITCTQINGTAFSGTNGNLVSFGASNTPADSGVVAANVVTAASTVATGVVPVGNSARGLTSSNLTISSNTLQNTTATTGTTLKGGNDVSSGSTLGGVTVVGASNSGAGASGFASINPGTSTGGGFQGLLQEHQQYLQAGTVTQWNLECPSSTTAMTVTDCSASPTNVTGVAATLLGGSTNVQVHVGASQTPINASAAVTVGHTVCAGSTAGKVTDSGGTTTCTNAQGQTIGIVIAVSGSAITDEGSVTLSTTLPLVTLTLPTLAPSPSFSGITTGSNTTATMTVGSGGSIVTTGTGTVSANQYKGAALSSGLVFEIGDPGGSALTNASTSTAYVTVPYACTISAYNLVVDAGTITVKFWKVATGTAIPTSGNSISTSGVSISSGTAIHSTTVTDFTSTAVSANDILAMNVSTVSTAKYVSGTLQCDR